MTSNSVAQMTVAELEHLCNVVEYLYHEEQKDYECCDSEDREDHIFNSIFVLDGVVNRQGEQQANQEPVNDNAVAVLS